MSSPLQQIAVIWHRTFNRWAIPTLAVALGSAVYIENDLSNDAVFPASKPLDDTDQNAADHLRSLQTEVLGDTSSHQIRTYDSRNMGVIGGKEKSIVLMPDDHLRVFKFKTLDQFFTDEEKKKKWKDVTVDELNLEKRFQILKEDGELIYLPDEVDTLAKSAFNLLKHDLPRKLNVQMLQTLLISAGSTFFIARFFPQHYRRIPLLHPILANSRRGLDYTTIPLTVMIFSYLRLGRKVARMELTEGKSLKELECTLNTLRAEQYYNIYVRRPQHFYNYLFISPGGNDWSDIMPPFLKKRISIVETAIAREKIK